MKYFQNKARGTWVAQLVKPLPSGQVMIPGSWDPAPHRVLRSEKKKKKNRSKIRQNNNIRPDKIQCLFHGIDICTDIKATEDKTFEA